MATIGEVEDMMRDVKDELELEDVYLSVDLGDNDVTGLVIVCQKYEEYMEMVYCDEGDRDFTLDQAKEEVIEAYRDEGEGQGNE
jgi:hypothetical protein